MNKNKVVGLCVLALVIAIALSGFAGYQIGWHRGHDPAETAGTTPAVADNVDSAAVVPVADVQTAPAAVADIATTVTAYGTAVLKPLSFQSVVVPSDVKIVHLLVVAGQHVDAGDPVADVVPTADVALALEQARSATDAADTTLEAVKGRYDMKLATTQDLQAAQAAARDAHLKLVDLLRRGADKGQTLKAVQSGIVDKIEVAPGQILTTGSVLIKINDISQTEVRIGVSPQLIHRLMTGQALKLTPTLTASPEIEGTIRQIVDQIDPETRLADILVSLPPDQHWMLGTSITAIIGVTKQKSLLVTRVSVLPEDGQQILYTMADGRAAKHIVQLGIQNDHVVEILQATPPLKAGDMVITQGNYELEDAMRVRMAAKP